MVFEVKNIIKNFGEKCVLNDISFSIQSGSALGLLGRNGAGKTTIIRIIMGVFHSNCGEILIDGNPINREKTNIGYLPEERGLYPKKQILEQLVYFGILRGMSKSAAKQSAFNWLERFGMSEHASKKLDVLSKGNQQKIQLIVALITNPELIILDEPFSGLDPVNAMMLKDVVAEQIKQNKIVLFSSHQMNYVEEFCEDIAILNNGKIVLNGNVNRIKRNYDRKRMAISTQSYEQLHVAVNKNLSGFISDIQIINKEVLVSLKDENEKNDFIRELLALNLDFDGIKVFEPTLNDIFVEYTEKSA